MSTFSATLSDNGMDPTIRFIQDVRTRIAKVVDCQDVVDAGCMSPSRVNDM
jgi:hypothetical protein